MKKISFSTKNYYVEESGIVRHKDTHEILTVLGHPSPRQKRRLWIKTFKRWAKEEWNQITSSAANAVNGPWNHGNQF